MQSFPVFFIDRTKVRDWRRCMAAHASVCFVGTLKTVSDIRIPISGYPILYPILSTELHTTLTGYTVNSPIFCFARMQVCVGGRLRARPARSVSAAAAPGELAWSPASALAATPPLLKQRLCPSVFPWREKFESLKSCVSESAKGAVEWTCFIMLPILTGCWS